MHHPIFEFADIFALIWPKHFANSTGLILFKLTFVNLASIGKEVLAFAVEHTIDELTVVLTPVALECAHAGLLTVVEVAFVFDFIVVPVFSTLAILLIFSPVSLVQATLSVTKSSLSVCHAVQPLTLINVSICVSHTAKAFKFAF